MRKEFNYEERCKMSWFLSERMGIKDALPKILKGEDTKLEIDMDTKTYTLNCRGYENLRFEIYKDGIIYF